MTDPDEARDLRGRIAVLEAEVRSLRSSSLLNQRVSSSADAALTAGGAQSRKMEALGQLASGVAHDFNNVAAIMLSGVTLLEKRYGTLLSGAGPESARLLAGLREGAERGAAISRRLLAFARDESLKVSEVRPSELLDGLHDVLRSALGMNIRVRVEAAADLPSILADRSLLETTLLNLAINARDAMPGGGVVTLGAAIESQRAGTGGGVGFVKLWVADTGTGMDAATLARAMQPFFTTKQADSGTGLGLSMADTFARRSGGRLAIQSTPSVGTTVSLWLPQVQALCTLSQHLAKPLALVVDDVPVMRRYLCHHLQRLGWEAVEAASFDEALSLLEEADDGTFALLLVDYYLPPGPDGLALISEARIKRPGIPAVLVTGSATPPDLRETTEHRTLPVVRKPVSEKMLAEAIGAVVLEVPTQPINCMGNIESPL